LSVSGSLNLSDNLDALSNVFLPNPADGEVLIFQASTQLWASITKAIDETISNDDVLHDDNDFVVFLNANKTYSFQLYFFVASDVAGGFTYQFEVPTGAIGDMSVSLWDTSPRTTLDILFLIPLGVSTSLQASMISGRIKTGGTAGNFRFRWSQTDSSPTPTTVGFGSSLRMEQV